VSARARVVLFAVSLAALLALMGRAMLRLPPSGAPIGTYARMLGTETQEHVRATDVVAAITFDYRGFDTLVEEMILFTAVLGVAAVLRPSADIDSDGDERDHAPSRPALAPQSSVRAFASALTGATVLFGLYVVTHGALSPGGGFQGGVVLATAPLVVFLARDAKTFDRIAPGALIELAEAAGAFAFLGIGAFGAIVSGAFLTNALPLGSPGDVLSAGTVLVLQLAVGLEVAAALVIVLRTFVSELLAQGGDG
jgi:multicomponent Na+:H+ antiporter subunit B